MITEPATKKLAPSHQSPGSSGVSYDGDDTTLSRAKSLPGSVSEKMNSPSSAVSMKFALVLMTLTRTVLLASVSARVKRPHMMALKRRFMAKKNYSGR